jgi:ketosteroid isomerase-like protein
MKMKLSKAGIAILLFPAALVAQSGPTSDSAKAGIDAGNQAWIDGMRTGNIAQIIATYADDAVDCGPTGECVRGRAQIEEHIKEHANRGKATSAKVNSWGSTQQGDFVYEWGRAEAAFANGQELAEPYLTVWQKQKDGSWKIFRNMVIPNQ